MSNFPKARPAPSPRQLWERSGAYYIINIIREGGGEGRGGEGREGRGEGSEGVRGECAYLEFAVKGGPADVI